MRKITIVLLLLLSARTAIHAQYSDQFTVTSSAATQVYQDDNTQYVGIGVASAASPSPQQYISALTLSNQNFASPPTALLEIVNNVPGTTLTTGISPYSFGVTRSQSGYLSGTLSNDFIIDGNGLVGIGTVPAIFNPLASSYAYAGTMLGIVDPNNTDAVPLLTVATNTNNPTGYNLAALTVDYRGYTSLGGYFPQDGFLNPAHLYLTDPTGGIDALMDVVTGANTQSLYIASNGNVGIGTASPSCALDVVGNAYFENSASVGSDLGVAGNTLLLGTLTSDGMAYLTNGAQVGISSSSPPTGVSLDVQGGVVRIGSVSNSNDWSSTNTSGYSLYVQGGVLAEKYKCALHTTSDWSDYVFDKDYKLKPLCDVESYIKDHHHLPDVPSTEDVACDGIDLGSMDATLLRKIEELTLYMLKQQKEIESLKGELSTIKK